MLGRMFPASYDRSYHGHWLALWLLGGLAVIKILMGLSCIFNGAFVAGTAAVDAPTVSGGYHRRQPGGLATITRIARDHSWT